MDREALREKFRGALLGVAIGDALGAPFEGMSYVAEHSLLPQLEGKLSRRRPDRGGKIEKAYSLGIAKQ